MPHAYIALGSNLQQPQQQIEQAFVELNHVPETRLLKQSSLYRTAPLDHNNQRRKDQPEFLNAVAEVETGLPAQELLQALLAIENSRGRERPYRNAPRVLDLDLLLYEDLVLDSPTLTLPHPRMHERGFVLLPLAEIAPELTIPGIGSVIDLAKACPDQGVARIGN